MQKRIRANIYYTPFPNEDQEFDVFLEWVRRNKSTLIVWGDGRRALLERAAKQLRVKHRTMRQIAANYRLLHEGDEDAELSAYRWGDVFYLHQNLFRQGAAFGDPAGYEWSGDYIEELPLKLLQACEMTYGPALEEPEFIFMDTAAVPSYTPAQVSAMTDALLAAAALLPKPVCLQWSWRIPAEEILSWARTGRIAGLYFQWIDTTSPENMAQGVAKARALAAGWPHGVPLIIGVNGQDVDEEFVAKWCRWARRLQTGADLSLQLWDGAAHEVPWSEPFGLSGRQPRGARARGRRSGAPTWLGWVF